MQSCRSPMSGTESQQGWWLGWQVPDWQGSGISQVRLSYNLTDALTALCEGGARRSSGQRERVWLAAGKSGRSSGCDHAMRRTRFFRQHRWGENGGEVAMGLNVEVVLDAGWARRCLHDGVQRGGMAQASCTHVTCLGTNDGRWYYVIGTRDKSRATGEAAGQRRDRLRHVYSLLTHEQSCRWLSTLREE